MIPRTRPATPEFEAALLRAEQALELVSAHLMSGQAMELESSCTTLQHELTQCTRLAPESMAGGGGAQHLQLRIKSLRFGLVQVREGLARRAAAVQRSLQALMPSSAAATYGRHGAAYGRSSRTAAAFTSLSA